MTDDLGPTEPPPAERDDPTDPGLELLDERGLVVHRASAPVVESLRYMLARLRVGPGGDVPERLGITSTIGGEGVSFVARTLALVLANDLGRHVCLVDLNWWSPPAWPEPDEGGIAGVITGTSSLDTALVRTANPKLWVLPAGPVTATNRPGIANDPELEKLLVELSERFDNVVVDLPAVTATSEALTLAESCGCVALVVCQGVTPAPQLREAVDELGRVQLLGVVLNRMSTSIPGFLRRHIPGA